MREPPKITQPQSGELMTYVQARFTREVNEVTAWMAEAIDQSKLALPASREDLRAIHEEVWDGEACPPEVIDALWQCSVCREMVPRHRHLEHMNAHTLQRAHVRHCPDCTPEQPCDRVRRLIGG
jgi:hypothetical protein